MRSCIQLPRTGNCAGIVICGISGYLRMNHLIPSWFDASVLATSFAEVWDLERARMYWDLAVGLAADPDVREAAIAQVLTLRELGAFYYIDSTDSGLRTARDAFNRAVDILRPEIHGTDRAYFQNSATLFMQAQLEDGLDNIELASHCICTALGVGYPHESLLATSAAKYQIASFVASVKSDTNDSTRAARYDNLPRILSLKQRSCVFCSRNPSRRGRRHSALRNSPLLFLLRRCLYLRHRLSFPRRLLAQFPKLALRTRLRPPRHQRLARPINSNTRDDGRPSQEITASSAAS